MNGDEIEQRTHPRNPPDRSFVTSRTLPEKRAGSVRQATIERPAPRTPHDDT